MTKTIVELKDIELSYPHKKIFQKVNFTLKEEQKLGIMGPNGAGKSTLFRVIMGLIKPDSGKVIIFHKERVREDDFYEVRKNIGFSFQDPDDQLFFSTVSEDIAFGPLNLGLTREAIEKIVRKQINLFSLTSIQDRIIYRLSGGEKRLAALAGVLAMSPHILLLDEPTGDLDRRNTDKLIQVLRDLDLTYVVISHDKGFLKEICEDIYWFEESVFTAIDKE